MTTKSIYKIKAIGRGFSYLRIIVKNMALAKLRTQNRKDIKTKIFTVEDMDIYESITYANPEQSAEDSEFKAVLAGGMKLLNDDERRVIYYTYWELMSVREIARATGQSKSSVDRTKQSAKEKLKAFFIEKGWDKNENLDS